MSDITPGQLPDLSKVKANAEAREAALKVAQQQERQKAVERTAKLWDRAMTRTFKGIIPAPLRRAMLNRAASEDD